MSRFMLALVAAAVAAVTAVAVVALPAIGDDSNGDSGVDAFAACLRANGLPGAPSDPTTLKPWIAAQRADNPQGFKRAMIACDHAPPDKPGAKEPGPDANDVIACVRNHGIDAPTDPVAFKQWLARQMSTDSSSLRAALSDCKILPDPGAKPGAGKCVAPADKPPADKPQDENPPADSTPPDEDGSV